jgi:FAD/FMN-containing dehydrogenase
MHPRTPDGFPDGVQTEFRYVENWSRMLRVPEVFTARPTDEEQCLQIVRWAAEAGWRARP